MIFNPKQQNTCLSAGVFLFYYSAKFTDAALSLIEGCSFHSYLKIMPLIVVDFPSI